MMFTFNLPEGQRPKRRTILSHDQDTFGLNAVGQVAKQMINALDFHNPVTEWIGTSRRVHAPTGAVFGDPTNATSKGVFWRTNVVQTTADTRPKHKSLNAAREGTPPNPGRPEYGSGSNDV